MLPSHQHRDIVPDLPPAIRAFLDGDAIAVAGVSRSGKAPANLILERLRDTGHTVYALNPVADRIGDDPCWPDLASLPDPPHGVVVCTAPDASVSVVRDALAAGVRHVWFHRSFGDGSVSEEAVQVCRDGGVEPIVGGCPMMFAGNVDFGHRCMRWWLQRKGRVPA